MSVKKILILTIAASMLGQSAIFGAKKLTSSAPPSGSAFRQGALYLGGGIGLGSGLGYLGGAALMANAEYALTNEIGIGGTIGYWGYSESLNAGGSTVKYSYSIVPIVVSGAFHLPMKVSNLDLGVGISLGYYVVNSSVETNVSGVGFASASGSGIAWGIFGLARYFINDTIALRGKIGYGITLLEVGVDFRF
ncbi:hypothetical protein [Turneriella parva]|uniref:Outer membrane protein beta-barrel domain-containing protein n=1 Tax=Turneriella parva (strain ATCC BAA-1111 / DSM 21527 / NCTC 11395 / H) TaxID=869212 RepID=I4B2I0_TURPD|nr:hypothetical protein [Turneriella parva]AFM11487.1 hypothetical protein Turpa_0836 [Turneriella parva DSM 21527]